jgi:hypothetical protein
MTRRSRSLAQAMAGAALAGLLGATPARAQGDCAALRGDEAVLPGEMIVHDSAGWKTRGLPPSPDVSRALTALDYGDELPVALGIELGGDGTRAYLLTSPGTRLCGTGGCPYVLLAGTPLRRIGEFFGHLAVLDTRINGHRVIQSYSRYRGDATSLDTYVFDGTAYRHVSHAVLDPCGLEQWRRRLRSRP